MLQPKLTGKRRSMDVKESDYPPKIVPLVPDLSPAQKAMIHEELTKSLLLIETASLNQSTSLSKTNTRSISDLNVLQKPVVRTESKSRKFGRKLKGLFINDQTKPPSRKQSVDTRSSNDRAYLNDDDFDEDELYHFDGRSKNLWGGPGI